jgi:hypothetical protein
LNTNSSSQIERSRKAKPELQTNETIPSDLEAADKDLASPNETTRWQAAVALGEFCVSDPEAGWPLVEKWGSSPNEETRTAIATCVLEHMLEHHFDPYISRCAKLVRAGNVEFADTFWRCWKIGQACEPANAIKFDRLERQARRLVRKAGPDLNTQPDIL